VEDRHGSLRRYSPAPSRLSDAVVTATNYSPMFLAAVSETLRQEGGYSLDPRDPGGETNFGISKRQYPQLDIKHLTRDDAIAIYYRDYWAAVRADELPWALALVLFDIEVNGGHPVLWLQQALGQKADGIFGPATLAAVRAATDPIAVASRVLRRRVQYYASLNTFSAFGAGWVQRSFDIYRLAITGQPSS
jgi:lysozyme family protein